MTENKISHMERSRRIRKHKLQALLVENDIGLSEIAAATGLERETVLKVVAGHRNSPLVADFLSGRLGPPFERIWYEAPAA